MTISVKYFLARRRRASVHAPHPGHAQSDCGRVDGWCADISAEKPARGQASFDFRLKALLRFAQFGEEADQVAKLGLGQPIGQPGRHEGTRLPDLPNGIPAQADFSVLQDFAQDELVAGLAHGIALVFLPVLGRNGHGVIAFLDLLLWFEDGADDEIDRLRGAQRAEIRTDIAALAVDRVAGSATEVSPPENFRATPGVAPGPDFAGELLNLGQGELQRFAAEAGGFGE